VGALCIDIRQQKKINNNIGIVSLLNFVFFLGPCHQRFFLTLRLLFLAMLELGAPLGSFIEEALHKYSI